MKIIINKIGMGPRKDKMSIYKIKEKETVIIYGKSGSGKTPMMCLISYAIGNRNAREIYFNQRNSKMSKKWGNELFYIEYTIEHNNKSIVLKMLLEIDVENEKIIMNAKNHNVKIISNSSSSTELRDYFFKEFNFNDKAFWNNTVVKRNFDEFNSFFFRISNLNQEKGKFYDIANTKRAPLNMFLSAYTTLVGDKTGIRLLNEAAKFKNLDKIIKRKIILADLIQSFETKYDDTMRKSSSNKVSVNIENILINIETLQKKKNRLLSEKSIIRNKINNISKNERLSKIVDEYNKTEEYKIDSEKFLSLSLTKEEYTAASLSYILELFEEKETEIININKEIKEYKQSLDSLGGLQNDEIEFFLSRKVNEIQQKHDETIENFRVSTREQEDFDELFVEWATYYKRTFDKIEKKVKEAVPEIIFKRGRKIKVGTGGEHALVYLKFFLATHGLVKECNNLPIFIDSLFETNSDLAEFSKDDYMRLISKSTEFGGIITMTDDDFKALDKTLLNREFPIFSSYESVGTAERTRELIEEIEKLKE